jgi:hypothetical protein
MSIHSYSSKNLSRTIANENSVKTFVKKEKIVRLTAKKIAVAGVQIGCLYCSYFSSSIMSSGYAMVLWTEMSSP